VLVVGANGAGKTNLLESLHVGLQGFSPRTRSDTELITFGERVAQVAVEGWHDRVGIGVEVILRAGEGKEARMNGARLPAAERLRLEVAALVFTPDRLAIVKGGPAARRAYFDRVLSRLQPAHAGLPAEYAAAIGQRNAALRRAACGFTTVDAISPWTLQVAELGARLVAARRAAFEAIQPGFAEHAEALGLAGAVLRYEGEPPTKDRLMAALARDLERGTTSVGPHLDDVRIIAGDRDLRSFGSQGEQRAGVLALLLAEAAVIADRRGSPPLLLLDDVLSELDDARRSALVERLPQGGQVVITTTSKSLLPVDADQLVYVSPGLAEAA
jgi:DNA replication and repair protein RecF